jgi:membrane fusion protein, multidrug efflux system
MASSGHLRVIFRRSRMSCMAFVLLMPSALLTACDDKSEVAAPPEIRPVRTVTVERGETVIPASFTGRIEALDEAAFGFRISGRMIERTVKVGDRVEAGQLLARLEPLNELNALRAAQANLAAAEAQLTRARNHFDRQQKLLSQGWTTRANFEQAEEGRRTAEAQVEAAEAQLEAAHDQVRFTELKADAPGVVTATGAEPGEVVQAGQMVLRIARQGGRDAVFDVPAQLLRSAPDDPSISVHLTDNPAVSANGRVRQVAPQADPVTRTFEVKVGLTDPPEAMRLGATVVGTMHVAAASVIDIPASALTNFNGQPAVWVVDPSSLTVAIRNVDVLRFDPAIVAVSEGLDTGEVVVTAGVQALRPGQKVRLLGSES